MKAIIKKGHHPKSEKSFNVIDLLHSRIVVLDVDGVKTDFGISEVDFLVGTTPRDIFYAGKFLSSIANGFRNTELVRASKKCAKLLGLKQSECSRALSAYNFA